MADTITVQENQTVVSVKDQDNYPVTITNRTVGVAGGDNAVTVVEKSGDTIKITDSDSSVTIEEKSNTIQPQFKEILQIIKEVPAEEEMMYKEEVDFVGEDLIYRGWANPGSATSAPTWRIRRTRFIGSDDDVIHDWAGGNADFNKIWDDRATYSYS